MELTEAEKADLKTVLVQIFGSEAREWEMNEKILAATGRMLSATQTCSEAMDYVPRPTMAPDLKYLKRQLRDMARRAKNHDRIYQICRDVARAKWRTEMHAASYGL